MFGMRGSPFSPLGMFGPPPVYHSSYHSSSSSSARRRRAAAVKKKQQEPHLVCASENDFTSLLTQFLVDGKGSESQWREFRQLFAPAPVPFAKKISLLQKIINSGDFHWWRCRQLINELPEKCDKFDDLISLVVPLYFATDKYPQNLITKAQYQEQKYLFALSIGSRLTHSTTAISVTDFSKLLTAKSASGDLLAKSLTSAARHYGNFANTLFSLLDQCLGFDKFDQVKLIHGIVNNYLTLEHQNIYMVNVKIFSILKKMLHKGIKEIDATVIFDLLKKIPISLRNFKDYSALLVELLHHDIDQSAIKDLIKDALTKPTIPDGHKNPKPMYTLISISDFGSLFYQLAKEDLLPTLTYSKEMKEAVLKHIESLSDNEKGTALLSIKKHDQTQVCDFFWKTPKHTILFGTRPYLSTRFKARIDAGIPAETTTLEQNTRRIEI